MVDIGATMPAAQAAHHEAAVAATLVEVRPADDMALADYDALCRRCVHAPAQHPVWVRSWVMATGADAIIVTLHRSGRPAFALALEIAQEGPFRIARFPGARHANGNFAAAARDAGAPLSSADAQALIDALRDARPDIDLIFLQRQNPDQEGIANPFSELATMRSPNVSLAVDLSGGFDEMLARRGGKRKRKKHRFQLRKFEDAGGYRLIEADTPEEVERLIGEFYAMKSARFRERGIPNVFAPLEVQTFFRLLFRDALERKEPPFVLHGLEVGGDLRAVNGCSVTPRSVVCEFGSIRDDDSNASPGYFLDYSCIQQAARTGKAVYDFSVGDEDYKRSWCDVETWQFDTLLPLTARGRVAWACEMARAQAIRLVKSNDALWSLLKQLRAKVAGGKPAVEG